MFDKPDPPPGQRDSLFTIDPNQLVKDRVSGSDVGDSQSLKHSGAA